MSIYDEIGGADAVAAAVDIFYQRVLADPELAPYFTDTDLRALAGHQRAFIAAALGGPELYAGRDLSVAHHGRGIDDAAFDGVVGHLAATLAELGVPETTIAEIADRLGPLRPQVVAPV
jgi:hemoglobin